MPVVYPRQRRARARRCRGARVQDVSAERSSWASSIASTTTSSAAGSSNRFSPFLPPSISPCPRLQQSPLCTTPPDAAQSHARLASRASATASPSSACSDTPDYTTHTSTAYASATAAFSATAVSATAAARSTRYGPKLERQPPVWSASSDGGRTPSEGQPTDGDLHASSCHHSSAPRRSHRPARYESGERWRFEVSPAALRSSLIPLLTFGLDCSARQVAPLPKSKEPRSATAILADSAPGMPTLAQLQGQVSLSTASCLSPR